MQPRKIHLRLCTLYLLPCEGGYLQIDTAYERDYAAYRRRLDQEGIDLMEVRYLFLTHHHDDHAGFLNAITRDGAITVIAQEKSRSLLQTGKNDKTRGGGYVSRPIRLLAGVKSQLDPHWTLTFPPFALREGDICLEGDDGHLLRRLGIPGTILYTPGHCIDHQVIVMESGEAFCGDAAASMLLWAGARFCPVFMTDMAQAYQSWEKMLAAGAQQIYPAHGRPFPAAKLAKHLGQIDNHDLIKFF